MTKSKVIEIEKIKRDYDFLGTVAIADHPQYGRVLLQDGFSGLEEHRGGMVRWEGGKMHQIKTTDTLASLRKTEWNDDINLLAAVNADHDQSRPLIELKTGELDLFAKSLGI